nr:DUF5684 domain-containing protein [uncultured Oscillibacter sp.]
MNAVIAAAALLQAIETAGRWRCFQKMGCSGWEALLPVCRTCLLFHELYGSGRRALLLLLPVYNVYVLLRLGIDLAFAFNRSAWFGAGLALLPFLFFPLLGFGRSVYLDGSLNVQ